MLKFQNLTEFNTAHNRRITALADLQEAGPTPLKLKRKRPNVRFNEDEEVINPGKFLLFVETETTID